MAPENGNQLTSYKTEYGPLKIRVQSALVANTFNVYVEDPRIGKTVLKGSEISTRSQAMRYVMRLAGGYLKSRGEHFDYDASWVCNYLPRKSSAQALGGTNA